MLKTTPTLKKKKPQTFKLKAFKHENDPQKLREDSISYNDATD